MPRTHAKFYTAYAGATSVLLLGHWPFVGSYYEVTTHAWGPAESHGTNVSLQYLNKTGFVQIRRPGFLNIPAIDLRETSFAIEFILRLP